LVPQCDFFARISNDYDDADPSLVYSERRKLLTDSSLNTQLVTDWTLSVNNLTRLQTAQHQSVLENQRSRFLFGARCSSEAGESVDDEIDYWIAWSYFTQVWEMKCALPTHAMHMNRRESQQFEHELHSNVFNEADKKMLIDVKDLDS
jgi:hypothetical protein